MFMHLFFFLVAYVYMEKIRSESRVSRWLKLNAYKILEAYIAIHSVDSALTLDEHIWGIRADGRKN
jgi:hypothetical protein